MLKIFHLGIFGLIDVVVCLTILLYEVHSLVSGGNYLVAVIAVFGVERYTDTCLYVYRNVSKLGVVALVKLIYKIKRQALYLLNLLRIGDTKNKLVAAETSCKSASLYTLFDTAGNILDNLVTYGMSETVVYELEVVNVYKEYRNLCVCATLNLALKLTLKCASVIKL